MTRGRTRDVLTLGSYRRRRWMRRRLAELDRRDRLGAAVPGGGVPGGPGWGRRIFVALGTVAVVGSGTALIAHQHLGWTVGLDGISRPERLRPPVAAGGAGSYAFTHEAAGAPVGYDPCRPVEIVVNDELQPPGAEGVVEESVRAVADATGLELRVVGRTDERPSTDRLLRQPMRYGAGWAPVLLAWSDPEQEPELAGDVAGVGGSAAHEEDALARTRLVTGSVILDSPDLARMLQAPGGRDLVRAVVMHELGHLVGLDHVDDPGELMNADNLGRTAFGPGDLAGLAAVGSGGCR